MNQPWRVLIVEDSEHDAAMLLLALHREGHEVVYEVVDTSSAMRSALESRDWDVIISDHAMPRFSAPDALALAKELRPNLPFIILSGEIDLNLAVSLMKGGAQDYIQKRDLPRIVPAIERALKEAESIIKRQQAEEALEQAHGELRTIMDTVPVMIWRKDPHGRYTQVNNLFCDVVGINKEAIIGKSDHDIHPPEIAASYRRDDQAIIARGHQIETIETIESHQKKSGAMGWSLTKKMPSFDAQGNVAGTLGVALDITEMKRTEEALRESEEKYRAIIENMDEGYYEVNIRGNLTFFNESMRKISGYDREELLGMNYHQYSDDENARKVYNVYNRVYHTGEPVKKFESKIIRKDGDRRDIDVSISLKRNTEGHPTGFRGIVRDITERKRAEETISQTIERYHTILSQLYVGILVVNIENTVEFVNQNFCNQFGLPDTPSALIGLTAEEMMSKLLPAYANPESVLVHIREMVTAGRPVIGDEITMSNGHVFLVDHIPIIVNGKHIGRLWQHRDITNRVRSVKALKQSEERYRTILEEIEEGYQEVDLSGNFTFCNESFCKIFGYSKNELQGSNFRRYAADEGTADRVYRAYNQMYKAGDPLKRFEWDIITKNGARRSIEFSASLLRDEEGHRRGFRGIVRDVTERKLVEDQYRMMANSAQTGVYIVQGSIIRFVNPHILAYSGYPEEELIGKRVLHFVHPDDREMVREKARKMLAKELKVPYEYRIVDKNNQVKWLMETVTPISYQGRSAVLGNTMDITDRKQAEKKLQDALDSIRKAFSATVQVMVSAVEIRDPYTAGHQVRSADLAHAIATEMGLSQDKIDGIRIAGNIHDIGKLSVPAEILSKPTKLSELEFALIKHHSQKGFEILVDVESPWPLAETVYQHHERMDGSGYPRHLRGEEILIEARILAVADVVESMASHRPYRAAVGLDAALEEIEKNRGLLYDRHVVDACLRLFREKGFQF